jgi:hypothetical protein
MRSFIICTPRQALMAVQIREGEMARVHNTHGGDEKCNLNILIGLINLKSPVTTNTLKQGEQENVIAFRYS